MDRVPDGVDRGDLVRQKLHQEKRARQDEDRRLREHIQPAGKVKPPDPVEKPKCRDRAVEAKSRADRRACGEPELGE